MTQTQEFTGTERRARDRLRGIQLRRRQEAEVEEERRQRNPNGFDIAAALELHLDEHKTRRAMMRLLEQWLADARSEPGATDVAYVSAVERAIDAMKNSPDVETAIAVLQRR
jgi:hypothetical protein